MGVCIEWQQTQIDIDRLMAGESVKTQEDEGQGGGGGTEGKTSGNAKNRSVNKLKTESLTVSM